MMVTLISECEKKAINKTRRVLDAFANRIGERAWQTIITEDGLESLKKLLRKTASKNTAVSCHWIRSRSRSDLLWIVGNRSKFNEQGVIPVNSTGKNIINRQWENDWEYLPLIKALVSLSALFHDWGKASKFFQEVLKNNKIMKNPLRHEWVSIILLNIITKDKTDEEWLSSIMDGSFNTINVNISDEEYPMKDMPTVAQIIAWLIVSHHKLPLIEKNREEPLPEFKDIFTIISKKWSYGDDNNPDPMLLSQCLTFSNGFPYDSKKWVENAKKYAKKLFQNLPLLTQAMDRCCLRAILSYTRLSLMLGDHLHSSKDKDPNWKTSLDIYANTDRKTKTRKQFLDEHLIGVKNCGVHIAHFLPMFENLNNELPRAYDIKFLKNKSPIRYKWQDTAVEKIKSWRNQVNLDKNKFGFFGVNMASTGKGKTFANGKIMQALSPDGDSLRLILSLGLRTLTLQTGDVYREKLSLGNDQMAVLIGSRAVIELHEKLKKDKEKAKYNTGSESEEDLFNVDNEIFSDTQIPEDHLSTLLTNNKSRQHLYAPVLCCTIDHIIPATETKKGGRYILPFLRLMSSDIVIDEVDDFDGTDLIAIGRLIHLAGMLGRKVLISSATITPDIAEGFFNAYKSGWIIFSKTRNKTKEIGCLWTDEYGTQVYSI